MTPEEALDKADRLVSTWMEQVKNARGYVHDKWQPADPKTRTDAVLRIAAFLLEHENPPSILRSPHRQPVATTWGGWAIDGSQGPPSLSTYNAAKAQMAAWAQDPNRPRPTIAVEAVELVIAVHEATLGTPRHLSHAPADCPGPPECM